MNILLLNTLYPPYVIGGAELSVASLAEGLARKKHTVSVITLSPNGKYEQYQKNGVNVYRVPISNIYFPFSEKSQDYYKKAIWHIIDTYNPLIKKTIRGFIEKIRPDIVNTHNIGGFSVSVWGGIKYFGLPLVHTIRDHKLLCPKSSMFRNNQECKSQCFDCRIYSWPRIKCTKYVDTVVGISQYILDRHKKHGCFPNAYQSVIYNAYKKNLNSDVGKKPGNKIKFGFLGRIHPTKGLHKLIEAFCLLNTGFAELWIGGTGEDNYERSLKSLTSNMSNVIWLGYVKPEELLCQVDVLVVPSLWQEPFGRTVIEAFAYGVPVIGSDRGGIPELITEDTGWIFEPDKPDILQKYLYFCLNNRLLVSEKGQNALKEAEKYTCKEMVAQYVDVYGKKINKSYR